MVKILITIVNHALLMIGSASAGVAVYRITGDSALGLLTFSAVLGIVGAIV